MIIEREIYLNRLINRMHNGMIKVITGIRRCGKSFLLYDIFAEYLRASGVGKSQIIELALDDEKNAVYRDPAALYEYLLMRIKDKEKTYYVLLDEVQYAISNEEIRNADQPPRLYGVLNGLLRLRNVDIFVTGSNSRLLSTDVMTEFRGRGDEVHIRPFSFAEFMQGFAGDKYDGWTEYAMYGGLPLVLSMQTDEEKVQYLENLFTETYLKDIIARNKISKMHELENLIDVLASNIGGLSNPPKLEATFKSELHSDISANTIATYIGYLQDSFLIEEAKRFDVKGRKYIGSPKKYYFEDMGLRNARLKFRQVEQTHIMENIIYNELRMRGYSVDIGVVEKRGKTNGKDYRKSYEVDFVANLGNARIYIQSAYRLPDEEKVSQEKAPLKAIDDSFKKIILVHDIVKPLRDNDGILTMSVYDFLLNNDSLEW